MDIDKKAFQVPIKQNDDFILDDIRGLEGLMEFYS